jgi:hypothetical protein
MPHFAEILSTNDRLVEILKIYGEPVASDSADAALQKVAMDHGLFQFLDRCEHGSASDRTYDMFDHLLGELDRNAAFPPCRVCGVAMDLFLATPEIDTRAEERMFKCRTCGMFESKLVEIK